MSQNTVYHYCSVEVFRKIITNKELWMTDVTKSNDSKELQLAFDKLSEVLNNRTDIRNEINDDFVPLKMFYEFMSNFKVIEQLFHVCCFSVDSDSLNQWAMYAGDASGLAIGFDGTKFEELKEINGNIDYGKIEYSVDSLCDMINDRLDNMVQIYKEQRNNNNFYWYENFVKYLIDDFLKIVYMYKNSSFEQEHEYRLVLNCKPYSYFKNKDNGYVFSQKFIKNKMEISDKFELGDIGYYTSRGRLVSYRPLKIKNFNSIINEIVIGPKSLVTKHDIEIILMANGINLPIHNIKFSNSTYQ